MPLQHRFAAPLFSLAVAIGAAALIAFRVDAADIATANAAKAAAATDRVSAIAIFNEKNPQRDVVNFTLGPRAGRAAVSTRIRLATSQKLVAVAMLSDGTCWSHGVDVIVALAACIE